MCLISSFFFSIKIILKQKRKTESLDNILFYLWKYLWKILASDILDRIQMNRLISKLESIFFSFVSQNNKYKYRKICYVFDIKFKLDPCISNYLELFQELVKENWWIISSRERERIPLLTTCHHIFRRTTKNTLRRLYPNYLNRHFELLEKSVKKRQLQHSHDSNFSQVWKSLSHFQYFLAHFHSQLSLLQITLTNFYKLKDSFIWKWIITIRRWKLEKYCTSSSASMSPSSSQLFSFSFFYNDARFKKNR